MRTDPYGRRQGWVDPERLDHWGSEDPHEPVDFDTPEENVVTSLVHGGWHRPALDIDFPCRLIESSTPGHHHLYLDGVMIGHEDYMELLRIFARCGIIGDGYARFSIERGFTSLRLPDVRKPDAPHIDTAPFGWYEDPDDPYGEDLQPYVPKHLAAITPNPPIDLDLIF